jgi:predicted RNA-binding Zn-ribbon protein involved in translation (DUF1610 family)
VVSVVLLLVWGASAFGAVRWVSKGGLMVGIGNGLAGGGLADGVVLDWRPTGLGYERTQPGLRWWLVGQIGPGYGMVFIPLWLPFTLALAATITARRLDAKARRLNSAHACPRCAYPRAGLAAGAVCPECGAEGTGETMTTDKHG